MEDGEGEFSGLSISELISILRTSFRKSVFDKVEQVLVARERKLKEELDRKEKDCEFLRKKKRASSVDEENVKRIESEHAKRGVEDENWKGREPRASLSEKYYLNMSNGDSSMGEGEAPEKCENRNANSAERRNEGKETDSDENEKIAAAETLCNGGTSSRTSKIDHVINLQKKPGVKRKRNSYANSLDEIVNIDDDGEITEASKPSKKPQESNTDPGVTLLEASPGGLNENQTMNTWTKPGATSPKVCEEHSLLKTMSQIVFLDCDDDDDSLDDSSSSSDSVVDTHPLLRNLK